MSARVESAPIGTFNAVAITTAVLVALSVGVVAGTIATRAGEERSAAVTTRVAGTQLWDQQKLEAMEGRQLAEQARADDPITKPHVPRRPPAP